MGDITALYQMDMPHPIAGTIDIGTKLGHRNKIGLPKGAPYINAGVILMDLKVIRGTGIHRCWERLTQDPLFANHDQDIINATAQGGIVIVGPEYNCSQSTGLLPRDQIKIVHYAGRKNPWVEDLPLGALWKEAHNEYESFKHRSRLELL
jgi:lipopolysaccharide biosynthesis glycosyltransferase